jgi:hypothetical protein
MPASIAGAVLASRRTLRDSDASRGWRSALSDGNESGGSPLFYERVASHRRHGAALVYIV